VCGRRQGLRGVAADGHSPRRSGEWSEGHHVLLSPALPGRHTPRLVGDGFDACSVLQQHLPVERRVLARLQQVLGLGRGDDDSPRPDELTVARSAEPRRLLERPRDLTRVHVDDSDEHRVDGPIPRFRSLRLAETLASVVIDVKSGGQDSISTPRSPARDQTPAPAVEPAPAQWRIQTQS